MSKVAISKIVWIFQLFNEYIFLLILRLESYDRNQNFGKESAED